VTQKKPRRGAGDGTLFKRADGYWVGGIELPPGPDGHRRYKRIVRSTRNAAVKALRDLRRDIDTGRVTAKSSTTLGAWLDHWRTHILPHRKLAPNTIANYNRIAVNHITPTLGRTRLDRLTPVQIREFYVELTERVSGRAAQKADQVLRLAIKAAIRDGIIGINIMDRVDKPAHRAKDAHAFSAAETLKIIDTAFGDGLMWGARWATGFCTAARESEILGLEWDRVDLDRGLMEVSWQLLRLQKQHGCGTTTADGWPCGRTRPSFCPQAHWNFPPGMVWRECTESLVWTRPKTRAGMRIIPLVAPLVEVLRQLQSVAEPNPHNLVFHRPDGHPITQDQDQRAWKKLLADAGIEHQPQHSVRHSTATLLLEAGVDVHIVQSVIGHSDIAMTRQYQHVNMDLARAAWSNLDTLLPITAVRKTV